MIEYSDHNKKEIDRILVEMIHELQNLEILQRNAQSTEELYIITKTAYKKAVILSRMLEKNTEHKHNNKFLQDVTIPEYIDYLENRTEENADIFLDGYYTAMLIILR